MMQGFVAEKSLGYFQSAPGALDTGITLASLAGGSIPAGTVRAHIEAEVQAVRWRDDGVAPTATVGMPLPHGRQFLYDDRDLANLRFIGQVAGAVLNVTFYGTL